MSDGKLTESYLNSAMVDDLNAVVASATGSPALGLQANGTTIVWPRVAGEHRSRRRPIKPGVRVARSRNARFLSDSSLKTSLM